MSDFTKELSAASNLQLWQSYCEKKQECELLNDQLTTITKQRDDFVEKLQLAYDLLLISGWDDCYANDIRSIIGLLSTIKEQKDAE